MCFAISLQFCKVTHAQNKRQCKLIGILLFLLYIVFCCTLSSVVTRYVRGLTSGDLLKSLVFSTRNLAMLHWRIESCSLLQYFFLVIESVCNKLTSENPANLQVLFLQNCPRFVKSMYFFMLSSVYIVEFFAAIRRVGITLRAVAFVHCLSMVCFNRHL